MTKDKESASATEAAKSYRVEFGGMIGIVWATSAGKARYRAALSVSDAGWLLRPNPSRIKCVRAYEFDHIATAEIGKCYHPDYVPKN